MPTNYIGAAEVAGLQIDVSQVVDNLRLQRVQVVDCRAPRFYSGEKKEKLYNVVNSGRVQFFDHREVRRRPAVHCKVEAVCSWSEAS